MLDAIEVLHISHILLHILSLNLTTICLTLLPCSSYIFIKLCFCKLAVNYI